MYKKYSSLLIPLILAACACPAHTTKNTAIKTAPIDQQHLSAYHWQLVEAKNANNQRLDGFPAKPTIKLDFRDDHLNLSGSCNGQSASYSLKNNKLSSNHFIGTMMACAEPLMQQDRATNTFLSAAPVTLSLTENQQTPVLLMQDTNGNQLIWQGTITKETQYHSKPQTVFFEVKPQTKTCEGAHGKQPCLRVRVVHYDAQGKKTRLGSWQNFSDQIAGYQHDPLQQQILRVNRYTISQPAEDQTRYAWELDMVVESSTVH